MRFIAPSMKRFLFSEAMMSSESVTPSRAIVALIRCPTYERTTVDRAMRRGIELLGGCGTFARPGERILFKPNVLWGTDPARCIVTHPEVLRAAVAAFISTGSVMQYGDSPAGLPGATRGIRRCGYQRTLQSMPAAAVSFDKGAEVDFANGSAGRRLRIARAALAADGIVNLPKLKTHGLFRMTGAIKNLFGCVPGMTKGQYHARFPDVYDFAALLADIAAFLSPRLHIMDAVEAMEGNGPQSGTPKRLGALLLSTDPVALDTVACRMINLDPDCVPTIAAAERRGLGTAAFDAIDCFGDTLDALIDRTFQAVRSPPSRLPQNGVLGGIRRLFLPRPVIRRSQCTRCGRCVSACPVKPQALRQPDRERIPVYNYARCIRCYCCQEVCPSKAIVIRRTIAGLLLPFMSYISLLVARRNSRLRPGPE
ncbi:MAG: DUF362 domain-containing protein [Chitinispirillaceae bacterium]|nr:DUF362 domain-containing protein [Chitinispirillaceae bacterium]